MYHPVLCSLLAVRCTESTLSDTAFPYWPKKDRKLKRRHPMLIAELRALHADVICLQASPLRPALFLDACSVWVLKVAATRLTRWIRIGSTEHVKRVAFGRCTCTMRPHTVMCCEWSVASGPRVHGHAADLSFAQQPSAWSCNNCPAACLSRRATSTLAF